MKNYLNYILMASIFFTIGTTSFLGDSEENLSHIAKQTKVVKATSEGKKKSETFSKNRIDILLTTHNQTKNDDDIATKKSRELASSQNIDAEINDSSITIESFTDQSAGNSKTSTAVNEVTQVNSASVQSERIDDSKPISSSIMMQADQLAINGQIISYSNAGQGSGQAIIDANPNEVATWGGASVQSGKDSSNTHFIGHNPGVFNVLFSLSIGATIEVSDSANNISTYTVSQIVTVDDSGISEDGVDYWERITGTSGGERITLQTCINDNYNLIVFAN